MSGRRTWLAAGALVLGAALVGAGCSDDGGDDEEPPTTATDGSLTVTGLLAERPTGEVAVRGALYAEVTPAADVPADVELVLCDRVGTPDVPDVPPLECQGASVPLADDGVDPWSLDLTWRSADGTDEVSQAVTLRGELVGDELVVASVEVGGEVVDASRPPGP